MDMAASLQSLLLALDSRGEAPRHFPASLLVRAMELHASRRRKPMAGMKKTISKRRWSVLQGHRKPRSRIERQVQTLQRLVPNGESSGLEGLFRKAADYIASLQMKVKLMQIMVSVLSGDADE